MPSFSAIEVESVFFKAMRAGYATGRNRDAIPQLPGAHLITHEEDGFKVTDSWQTTPHSNKSFGTTTIAWGDAPVWMMHYWGWYDKMVISLLKRALADAYNQTSFIGGRGPRHFQEPGSELVYTNNPVPGSDFARFSGQEKISEGNRILGVHSYHGHMLL